MKIKNMNRGQLEMLARKLGIQNPQHYLMPQLREAVKARYHKNKSEGK